MTPIALSSIASAAPLTHSGNEDRQDTQDSASNQAVQKSVGRHAAPGAARDMTSAGWGKTGRHAAPAAADSPSTPAEAGPSGLHTEYSYLSDATQGKQLWAGPKGQTAMPMGSITKVMTALVITKHHSADLDKLITVKQAYLDYVQQNGASTADLKAGDQLTARQLLSAMLVPSGCDAAQALADTFGQGDTYQQRVASFVDQMNAEAQTLGMTSTHFDTPDGISQQNTNHSSPADLTKLGTEALKDSTIAGVVHQDSARQVATNGRVYTWNNTDKLLTEYDGALGIKTGSGPDDGYCLLFAAQRNGHTLVGAVLQDTEDRFDDAASILDWGFSTVG